MDVSPAANNTLSPPPGWARIELEPVDVPLEPNGGVLLSAIQSAIPGAHGLYYKDDNCNKALRYDWSTGCISRGPPGWNTKPIYVVLAHGCRHYSNSSGARYDVATERFEKTVNLIQRMLTDQWTPSQSYKKSTPTKVIDRKHSTDKSLDEHSSREDGREVQSEDEERNGPDLITEKCSKTSSEVWKLQEENNVLKQRIEELMIKIDYLRGHRMTLPSKTSAHESVLNLEQRERTGPEEKFENSKQQQEEVQYQQTEKDQNLKNLELSLSEHKQHIINVQTRVRELEMLLDEEKNKTRSLANLNTELNTKLQNLSISQQPEMTEPDLQLKEELDEKNHEIDNLRKQIDDLKWSLGEQKQWLKDANDRANYLDNLCKQKDYEICNVTNKLHDTEHQLSEASILRSTELGCSADDLRKEIDKKNSYISELEKAKNDAEWYLGEHRQWLQDANNRMDKLENERLDGWKRAEELEKILNQIKSAPTADNYNEIKAQMEKLQQNIDDKILEYNKLNEQKNEVQCHLEEQKVCLEDAEKRIKYLENEKDEKEQLLMAINNELGELRKVRIEAFQQLHEVIDSLDSCLFKKQCLTKSELKIKDTDYTTGEQEGTRMNANQDDLERLNEQVNELKQKNEQLQKDLQEKQESLLSLSDDNQMVKEVDRLQVKMDELLVLLNQANKQKEAVQEENNCLNSRIQKLLEELEETKQDVMKSEQKKNDAEWSLGEHRQWLLDANNKITELENTLREVHLEGDNLRERTEKLHNDIRVSTETIEALQKEINDQNERFSRIEELKNCAECSLGEHQQWLQDANNRINELNSMLCERNHLIEELKKWNEDQKCEIESMKQIAEVKAVVEMEELAALHTKIEDAEKALAEAPSQDKLSELNAKIECLQNEMNGKNELIKTLEKQRNDTEWALGQHRQWLQDSNNKIQDLEIELRKNNEEIGKLRWENENRSNEIGNHLAMINTLRDELSTKNSSIINLEKAKNDAEWSLGEHRQWLLDANNRIAELTHVVIDKDQEIAGLQKAVEASKITEDETLETSTEASPKSADEKELSALRSTVEELLEEVNGKNAYISELEKQRNDLEWSLGEHRQWLQDVNDRATNLDNSLKERSGFIDELQKQIEALQRDIQRNGFDENIVLQVTIDGLKKELSEKNDCINELIKQRNDAEWSLGEHKQWLTDSRNQAQSLVNDVETRDKTIADLRAALENFERTAVETRDAYKNQFHDLERKLAMVEHFAPEADQPETTSCLNLVISNLRQQLESREDELHDLQKQQNDLKWNLEEHRQWLQEANDRAASLENDLQNKCYRIDELQREIESKKNAFDETDRAHRETIQNMETKLRDIEQALIEAQKQAVVEKLNETIINLRCEIDSKSQYITTLEKTKDDAEWSLGEHRQWLKDANDRVQYLDAACNDKDRYINELQNRLREAERPIENADVLNNLNIAITDLRNELKERDEQKTILEKDWNEAQGSLAQHRQWLQHANERITQLEKSETTKAETIKELRSEIDELSKRAVLDLKAALEAVRQEVQLEKAEVSDENLIAKPQNAEQLLTEQPKSNDLICLNNENKNLKELLNDKNAHIDDLVQQLNDKEWSLGEHRQWLQDSKDRANWLESVVLEKNHEIDGLRSENECLKCDIAKISQGGDICNLNAAIENLRHEIGSKNEYIEQVEKQRNDAEWSLGEHRQWLRDANSRVDELTEKLAGKEQFLNLLFEKCPELLKKEYDKVDTTFVESEAEEGDKSMLIEKISQLETKLVEVEKASAERYDNYQLKIECEKAERREELAQKDAELQRIYKQYSESEWFLGEERQRLNDANQRIAQLEKELICMNAKHEEILHNSRKEIFELNQKNTKLEETVTKTEVLARNLSKEAKTTMLILEQIRAPGNLDEEFKQLSEKYLQLTALLTTTEEHLNKIQTEASGLSNSNKELKKIIENLNNELQQHKAENENLIQQKNDAEWHLGEHREWLQNANNRISVLEDELSQAKEVNKRTLESMRMENETLIQKNTQLKEDMKHLMEETQVIRRSVAEKGIEEHTCWKCRQTSEFSHVSSFDEDLSAIRCSLENLCNQLNYQKIIDTLMEQRSNFERLLEERKESITDAYKKITELEEEISGNTPTEQEVAEIRTVLTKSVEQAEKVLCLEYMRSKEATDFQEDLNELQQQLICKNNETENLVRLKYELERNLEEVTKRKQEMSLLLDEKEQTIKTITNEKNAIALERDALKEQVDSLKQRFISLSPFAVNEVEVLKEDQNVTELMVRLCEKENQLQQITTEMTEKVQEITNLHNVIKDLRDVINEKNHIIDDLNRVTSEKEWSLGEYRQWLADANNKVNYLETELNAQQKTKSSKMELDMLMSEIDEKNAKISELHDRISKLESEAINVQYEKEMAPNEEFSLKLSALREKLSSMEEYVQFQNEELKRLKKEQTQSAVEGQGDDVSLMSTTVRPPELDTRAMSEDYNELSSELITLNRKKYELEGKTKRLENELQESYEKIKGLEDELRKMGEEVWLAKERVANQDRELENLHGQCSWLRDENSRLQFQIDEQQRRYAETGGVDWSKFDEMKAEMRQVEDSLRDEKSKVEWRLGEVTQYWNDAKWKIGELEAGMAHKQWLLDQAHQKIFELDQISHFRDTTNNALDSTFLIRKQPTADRYKWRLAMWNENSPEDLKDYRRIWFEIRAPTAKLVLLSASFVSWECFLQCQKLDNDADKFGVWVDIPPGRYEFVFVVDGNWATSENYATCWNEHGTHNNWRHVD